MNGQIVVITYKLEQSRDGYIEENLPYAQPIADVPGLQWKIWIINEAQREVGGVYFFADGASTQASSTGKSSVK